MIHGTNQPYGVGLRASHGCIRLYPEDIAQLFEKIPVGTKVTVVNQPQVYGYRGETLYLQSYPVLDDYASRAATKKAKSGNAKTGAAKTATAKTTESKDAAAFIAANNGGNKNIAIDKPLVDELIKNPNGVAMPISQKQVTFDTLVASAPRVENRVPNNATWDGVE